MTFGSFFLLYGEGETKVNFIIFNSNLYFDNFQLVLLSNELEHNLLFVSFFRFVPNKLCFCDTRHRMVVGRAYTGVRKYAFRNEKREEKCDNGRAVLFRGERSVALSC